MAAFYTSLAGNVAPDSRHSLQSTVYPEQTSTSVLLKDLQIHSIHVV